jgi:hypothetical protein
MLNAGIAQLDYAPAGPSLRRRRVRRVILFCLLVAVAWAGYRYGGSIWEKSKVLYYQRECLYFSAPPGQVVYDDDPADLAVIGARRDYQVLSNKDFRAPGLPRMAAFSPGCWNDFAAAAAPNRSSAGAGAVVFCHELTSRDGVRRLVVVQRNADPDQSNYNILSLEAVIIQPGTFSARPVDVTPARRLMWLSGAVAMQMTPLRIYAGQVDAGDASRFTIRFTVGKSEHLVEGRLADGGNGVTFSYPKPIAP